MKNKITLIIFLLLIVLLIVAIFWGIKVGSFQILSVAELNEKNEGLNEKILTVSDLTTIEYPENIDNLEETYERYTIQKQKYEEISGFTKGNKKKTYETKQYDIGFLWETVGKYATSYNLKIGMEVKKGSGQDLYDLYFNVSGLYVNISEFIAKIENNSDLFFRIYNFRIAAQQGKERKFRNSRCFI